MPGTMSRVDLVADLKASLHDAADVFTADADADFDRLLNIAAEALARYRPPIKGSYLTLSAGVALYSAPNDLIAFSRESWTPGRLPDPWEPTFPGALPRVDVIGVPGARQLFFTPTPSAAHISALGSRFDYLYLASHSVSATAGETTISPSDRGLFLLRAQVEALREMAIRNINKPVQLRDGMSGMPKNGTPSYLYAVLLAEFERSAA